MKISILICSFSESKYLSSTVASILNTFPRDKYDAELLIDCELKRTGLANSTNRYMDLFKKSTGDIIVKSDDDVMYYRGWLEKSIEALLNDDKIGYISPISHSMMRDIGVRHAKDIRIPIEPDGVNYEPIASGMCWVFKRNLWIKFPYNKIYNTWKLDSQYSGIMKDNGIKIAALHGALISHLGQDRYKGVKTDTPGKSPSKDFIKRFPKDDYRVF